MLGAGGAFAQTESALEAQALSAGGVAGEIMDIAVEHCRRGERAQALSMFAAIRTQLEPPAAIAQLIRELEATGCPGVQASRGAGLRLQAGGGWDSNVSQGITARTLAIGTGENAIELELDESYRPRSSPFVTASLDRTWALPAGLDAQVGLAQRKNTRASAFDVTSLSAAASGEFKLQGGSARAQVEFSQVWLASRHYQRTQGLGMQWLRAGGNSAWLATLAATRIDYVTQPSQNAWQLEAGVLREHQLGPKLSVHASISAQQDLARGMRAGGDRKGFQVQAGSVLLAYGWRFKPHVSHGSWNSAEVFAVGLIDVRRRSRLLQASLQAEKPLSSGTNLVLEWRSRWARDTVALYRYQAQAISATLAHRF